MSKAWKDAERKFAQSIGTARTPLSGINSRHTSSDTLHIELYAEVKYTGKATSRYFPLYRDVREAGRPQYINHSGEEMVAFSTLQQGLEAEEFDNKDRPRNWVNWGVWRFFVETVIPKAEEESKIPALVVRVKNRHGTVILCRKVDYEKVLDILRYQASELR